MLCRDVRFRFFPRLSTMRRLPTRDGAGQHQRLTCVLQLFRQIIPSELFCDPHEPHQRPSPLHTCATRHLPHPPALRTR